MPRFWIAAAVISVALLIYGLVDLTVTDDRRIARLNRVLWIVLIVLLPVLGTVLWLTWGKAPRSAFRPAAPEDAPNFGSGAHHDPEVDRRIRELEEQLQLLDEEEAQAERLKPDDTPSGDDAGPDARP